MFLTLKNLPLLGDCVVELYGGVGPCVLSLYVH